LFVWNSCILAFNAAENMSILNSLAFFNLQGQELLVIGLIVLLFFGGAKIPQLMRGLGRGMGEFQEGMKDGKKKFQEAMNDTSDDEESTRKSVS
jgi:sec-independent protein translocase protein TatA